MPARFSCTKCGACCRTKDLIVTVTGGDIVRIATSLGLSSEEMTRVLDFYILSEDEEPPVGLSKSIAVKTEQGLAYPALKKMKDGSCIFLKNNLCMIHPERPVVCRSFPFTFSREEDGGISWGLSAMKEICPGLEEDIIVTDEELFQMGNFALEYMLIHKEFVRQWNKEEDNPTVTKLLDRILKQTKFYA